ncbi:MAG: ECF-type sigma factor [Chthoniobacterales bacterium]
MAKTYDRRSFAMADSLDKSAGFSAALIEELTTTVSKADAETLRGLLPAVYDELRGMAAGFLRDERAGHTLQPTALVHEAYLRMADQRQPAWQNRAQLLGVFARMMRRILIDHANARLAAKRGGKDAVRIALDEKIDIPEIREVNLLEVDEALDNLERLDAQQAKIVELRFFGGLTVDEIGQALAISPTTVKREWSVAKRWLQRELARAA